MHAAAVVVIIVFVVVFGVMPLAGGLGVDLSLLRVDAGVCSSNLALALGEGVSGHGDDGWCWVGCTLGSKKAALAEEEQGCGKAAQSKKNRQGNCEAPCGHDGIACCLVIADEQHVGCRLGRARAAADLDGEQIVVALVGKSSNRESRASDCTERTAENSGNDDKGDDEEQVDGACCVVGKVCVVVGREGEKSP